MARYFHAAMIASIPAMILAGAPSWGQGRGPGGFGTTSGSGLSGVGFQSTSGGLGSGGFRSGGLGTGGFGAGLGGGGFGQGGFGQGLGQGGLGGMMGVGGGQIGFGQQTQAGFVGRDSADVASMFESMTRQGEQFMNTFERSVNRERDLENAEQAPSPVRVKLTVAFDPPEPTSESAVAFDQRMDRILAEQDLTGIRVVREGDEVVITGEAATDWERTWVEKLARLQPGVTSVRNLVTVNEETGLPLPPPADR